MKSIVSSSLALLLVAGCASTSKPTPSAAPNPPRRSGVDAEPGPAAGRGAARRLSARTSRTGGGRCRAARPPAARRRPAVVAAADVADHPHHHRRLRPR